MISEKINRNNKREEKNMGKRKIIQITVLTTLVLTLSLHLPAQWQMQRQKMGLPTR